MEQEQTFQAIATAIMAERPYLRLSRVEVHGQTQLAASEGGMRVFWIYRGRGEVFLPEGFRTQEGDGQPLPGENQPDPIDPASYRLNTYGRTASLIVFPDLRDLTRYEQHPLSPGTFVYIPPGTGHRGLDVFVNVLTLPGFKPHNEYYIDRDIRDQTDGQSPYNESLLNAKNYDRIEDLLA